MKLTIQHNNLPLRAYPPEKLETEMEKFSKWISDVLGLTGIDAAKRLLIALPAVEKHFWSLGFNEIEKAFTMYVDGQLKTQPLPNYFTRILVGQIFKEYKQQKPINKQQLPMAQATQEEKDDLIYHGLICCFDEYIQTGTIINGRIWVHDHLDELGHIKLTDDEKKVLWVKALENCVELADGYDSPVKRKSELLLLNTKTSISRINEYKRLRLGKLFDVLHAKGKHIKDIL